MRIKHGRFEELGTPLLRTVGRVFSAVAVVLGIVGQSPMEAAQGIADKESTPRGTRYAMIVCGLPGDAEHEEVFAAVLQGLCDGLTERYGFPADQVLVWSGSACQDEKALTNCKYQGPGTRAAIEAGAKQLREGARREDALWVIVLGHAHFDGRRAWLNLPGPDIDVEGFGNYFQGIKCGEQVFFLTTPVSGYATKFLSQQDRVVITATEADREVNATIFPVLLAEVLNDPPPAKEFDIDGDGRITLLDLYVTVSRRVLQTYAEAKNIPTEHAQLDDNHDGRGTEVQLDYLEEELGGRVQAGARPSITPGADGVLALSIDLTAHFADKPPGEGAPQVDDSASPQPETKPPAPSDPQGTRDDPAGQKPSQPSPEAIGCDRGGSSESKAHRCA
ncbi:MAG: EF-hand domain-containing protein [Pirellulaceae bacterium]